MKKFMSSFSSSDWLLVVVFLLYLIDIDFNNMSVTSWITLVTLSFAMVVIVWKAIYMRRN
jgi:protein-S-isoprenylcysteine O-methyltransferase Ste14